MAKQSKRGTRYTAAQKAKVLAAAKKEGLTGAQVAKRFGISLLTFYRWRGPVRSDALRRAGRKRGPGRPRGNGVGRVDPAVVRQAVRKQIEKMLPQIIREEVEAAIGGTRRGR